MPSYKQFIIDAYAKEKLEQIDNDGLIKIFEARANLLNNDKECSFKDVAIIETMDHFITKKMENLSKKDSQMNMYIKCALIEFKNNPYIVFSNPMFSLPEDILSRYIALEDIKAISHIKKHLSKKSKDIYDKFRSEPKLVSKKEYKDLISFFTSNLSTNGKWDTVESVRNASSHLVKYMLDNNFELNLQSSNFVLRHIAYESMKEKDLGIQVFIADIEESNENNLVTYGGSVYGKKQIVISRKRLKEASFKNNEFVYDGYNSDGKLEGWKLVQTVEHEMEHENQKNDASIGRKDDPVLYYLAHKLIKKYYGNGDYNRNYPYQNFETDAEIKSWLKTIERMKKYAPSIATNTIKNRIDKFWKDKEYGKVETKRINKKGEEKYSFIYLTSYLNTIFKNHPEELECYPQFRDYYHADGSHKNLSEILSTEGVRSSSQFFFDQVSYGIVKKQLNDLDIKGNDKAIYDLLEYIRQCSVNIGASRLALKYKKEVGLSDSTWKNIDVIVEIIMNISLYIQDAVDRNTDLSKYIPYMNRQIQSINENISMIKSMYPIDKLSSGVLAFIECKQKDSDVISNSKAI